MFLQVALKTQELTTHTQILGMDLAKDGYWRGEQQPGALANNPRPREIVSDNCSARQALSMYPKCLAKM